MFIQYQKNPVYYQYLLKIWDIVQSNTLKSLSKRHLIQISKKTMQSTFINEDTVVKYLKSKGISFEKQYTSIIVTCPKAFNTINKQTKYIYINMITGQFTCQHCRKSGLWEQLQENLNNIFNKKKSEFSTCLKAIPEFKISSDVLRFYNKAIPLKKVDSEIINSWKQSLNCSLLQTATLSKFGVCYDEARNALIFPSYNENFEISQLKLLSFVTDKDGLTEDLNESLIPRTTISGLFGLSTSKERHNTEVILTSSEMEAMAVYQITQIPSLALPKRGMVLPVEILPLLERFKKVILWLGTDLCSWQNAKQFAKKLNEHRCFIIRPSEAPSAVKVLQDKMNMSKILNSAIPASPDSIVSFSQLRNNVYFELAQNEEITGIKWKKFLPLNKLLKGHRRGELTVFTGTTGAGKTTFMSEYSLDLCMQGVNTLWGSFEIHNVRLAKTMLMQFSQVNLAKNLDAFENWADKFDQLPLYFMTFFGQEDVKRVIKTMSQAVYLYDIAHVVIDNIQFMMGTNISQGNRFLIQDQIISDFRNFATTSNCHVTLVIHPRKNKDAELLNVASVFGGAKATQEADNVLILQNKYLPSHRVQKFIEIVKNRFDGEKGLMPLRFNREIASYTTPEKKKATNAPKLPLPSNVKEMKDDNPDEDD
ncbi:twinkle mtDNA helicase isoform X1 [Octopus bimaculoides]|uniref:DNA 5'-3' helicase n=1 Tax=Octopus bimaculoides TaxID=37653 RepID=A0A0L8FN71_OCTBM|nr:twinkle mtDNA helicase isoform X1 [Octopus bimaculoides]XP_052831543.1 twinkle mtDNA helicase isoform X1 [Octopus bimaculoides]|eukprot:XP_014788373.1 PREDICTED: twinkle protein, mitochondrial-like isoform X1 [Octopus bimaculoides]